MDNINENILKEEDKLKAEKKLIEALRLYFLARELKAVSLKQFYPAMSQEEIEAKVREFFLYGNT